MYLAAAQSMQSDAYSLPATFKYFPTVALGLATGGNLFCSISQAVTGDLKLGILVLYILYFIPLGFAWALLYEPDFGPATDLDGLKDRQMISNILVLAVTGLHFVIGLGSIVSGTPVPGGTLSSTEYLLAG